MVAKRDKGHRGTRPAGLPVRPNTATIHELDLPRGFPMAIRRCLSAASLTLLVIGCGSGPSEPVPSPQSVSEVLQRLSQDAIQQGYLDQGLILGQAAVAA